MSGTLSNNKYVYENGIAKEAALAIRLPNRLRDFLVLGFI